MATIITNQNIKLLVRNYITDKPSLPQDLRDVPIGEWDVSRVTNMGHLFGGYENFNENISGWNVSNVTSMAFMFLECRSFNQPLNEWDVSKVEQMQQMFGNCRSFNQPLNDWNIRSALYMHAMFDECVVFNQPLSNWRVDGVLSMHRMFFGCRELLQDFSMWNINAAISLNSNMFTLTKIVLQRRFNFLPQQVLAEYTTRPPPPPPPPDWSFQLLPPPPPPSNETQARSRQAELKARQDEIDSRVKKRALEEVQETSEFPECIICGELLNNMAGPGQSRHCQANCNDAIKVCGSGHIFHRGCILEACNAAPVDIVPGYSMNQQRRFKCPTCQKPLTDVNPRIGCGALNNIPAETTEALKEYKRQTGGKKRKLTKKNKRQYILTKKRKNKRKYRKTRRSKKA